MLTPIELQTLVFQLHPYTLISLQFKYRGVGFKWEQGCRPIFTEVTLMWLMRFLPGTAGAHWGRLIFIWRTSPWGLEELIVFSLCPFPDESAHVCQIWCQWVHPLGSYSRFLNVWPLKPPPPNAPSGIEGLIVFFAHVHSQMNPQACTKFGPPVWELFQIFEFLTP